MNQRREAPRAGLNKTLADFRSASSNHTIAVRGLAACTLLGLIVLAVEWFRPSAGFRLWTTSILVLLGAIIATALLFDQLRKRSFAKLQRASAFLHSQGLRMRLNCVNSQPELEVVPMVDPKLDIAPHQMNIEEFCRALAR